MTATTRQRRQEAAREYARKNARRIRMAQFCRYYDLPLTSLTEEDEGFVLTTATHTITALTIRELGRKYRELSE